MRDPQLTGDITRANSVVGELHYPLADDVREGSAVDEHSAQLVDPSVTCNNMSFRQHLGRKRN